MKNKLKKYILSVLISIFALSLISASANYQLIGGMCIGANGQQVDARLCVNLGNQQNIGGGVQTGYSGQSGDLSPIVNLIKQIQNIVGLLVPLAIGIAIVWFLFSLIKYFIAEKPEERSKNLKGMLWSILAIFVMVSIWGIVAFLNSVTGINQGGGAQLPGVPTYNR